jgi:hypothetical protein
MTRNLKAMLVFGTFVALLPIVWAQEPKPSTQTGEEQAQAAKRAPKGSPDSDATAIKAGTKVSAELQSSIDAKTAKPGDEVSARVTQNVKENGLVVIHKGDRLVGHVTEVKSGAEASGGSSLAVSFDRLVAGNESSELHTVVSAILSTPSEMRAGNEGGEGPEPMMAPGPGQARAGGGVLGGVGSTVGATTGSVAATTGGLGSTVSGTASGALGATGGAMVSTPIRAIRVGSSTSAQGSAESGSMLSTRHGNLHLESGTRMQFRVASSEQIQAK